MSKTMIGRKVKDAWHGVEGTIVAWEPLSHAMNDVKVERADGSVVWLSTGTSLKPTDGKGPLMSRDAARKAAQEETVRSLEAIKKKHIDEWGRRWPGAEHGKAIVGMAINKALADVRPSMPPGTRRG